jgi:tetratricopeptide (TPR) repeat protein
VWAAVAAAIAVAAFAARTYLVLPADPRLATARTQTELGQYRSAFETYREILKTDGANRTVLDLQAAAAMAWVRDFHVLVNEGQRAEDLAGPPLAEIISVLEAALARTGARGPGAADILAHLGWAHWLNQRIAGKEFGSAAEQAFRQSLEVDPGNFFAHAMLGNWLMQTGGDTAQALRHFEAAEKAKQQRPFLRRMQLGAMIYNRDPGIPAALIRVVNQMRMEGESLDARQRSRVMSYFRPGNAAEVREMLSAVPPAEAWATFQWLDPASPGDEMKYEGFRREFIHARVLEMEGRKTEALEVLTSLEARLRSARFSGRLLDDVSAAVKQLR